MKWWPYELIIGFRYLKAKRHQRSVSLNTFISIGGVTLGVAALISTLAVMTGFKEDLRDKILGTNSHIVITDRVGEMLSNYAAIREQTMKHEDVVAAAPFIYNQVLLSSKRTVYGIVVRGIDPALEQTVTDIQENIIHGTLDGLSLPPAGSPPGDETPPGIILGVELAGRFAAFLGDTINVMTPAEKPGPLGIIPKIRKFRVVGIFDSGMYEYDSTLAYISIKDAQEFFGLGDKITGIEVKVKDIFAAGKVAEMIEQDLGFEYRARDWMTLNRNLFSALQLEKIMMFIILILIILVASFNIVGTLTMIVIEKSREIAILKTIGAKNSAIMRIFMIDGLIIGLVGTAIGIPLGYGICMVLQNIYTLPSDIYYISHLPVKLRFMDIILVSISAITISFLATLYPSYRAAHLQPAEALRYE